MTSLAPLKMTLRSLYTSWTAHRNLRTSLCHHPAQHYLPQVGTTPAAWLSSTPSQTSIRENQHEASFILSSIDLTGGLGPLRVADHCESLGDAKKLLRSMSVTLGSISRHHGNVITSDYIISITATLHDLSSMRNVCLGELDKKSEGHEAASVYPRVLTAGAIGDDDSNGLAIEPKEIAAPVKCVEPSGFDIKMESLAVEEALDDAKELTADNAETRATKPLKGVSSLVNFFNKRSTAAGFGYQNSEKVSGLDGKLSKAPKLRQNLVKVVDPPWYKPEVSKVTPSTNISEMLSRDAMLRQETKASAPTPTPKNEMMPSLGSSFFTTDLAHLMMRLSLMLMFSSASTPESANNL